MLVSPPVTMITSSSGHQDRLLLSIFSVQSKNIVFSCFSNSQQLLRIFLEHVRADVLLSVTTHDLVKDLRDRDVDRYPYPSDYVDYFDTVRETSLASAGDHE